MRISKKSKIVREREARDARWSKAVRTRDGYCCGVCGSTERSNAHHIIPREVHEFKYHVDNGVTLCVTHHKFSRTISAHNGSFAFTVWLRDNRPELYMVAEGRCRKMNEAI